MKRNLLLCAFLLPLASCDPFYLKPLDVQTVTNGHLTARWFITSSITTVHNHVEIQTKKGWEQLLETDGNVYKLYDVFLDKDTVVVRTCPVTLVYQLESYYWGTSLRLDSSVSETQYDKKFRH